MARSGKTETSSITQEDFRSWNEEMAVKYNPDDYHRNSFFLVRWVERLRVGTLLRLLEPRRDDAILEIGCGAGNILERLGTGRAVGVDLSTGLLQVAKTKRYQTRCHLVQSFGEVLPFRAETFDKVICTEVLEHVPQPQTICAEAFRVLKPNGKLIFSVPNERLINSVKKLLQHAYLDRLINLASGYRFPTDMTEEWHLHSFDPESAQQVIEGLFRLEQIRSVPSSLFCLRIVVSCCKPG